MRSPGNTYRIQDHQKPQAASTHTCLKYQLKLDLDDLCMIDQARIQMLKENGTLLERKTFLRHAVKNYVAQKNRSK